MTASKSSEFSKSATQSPSESRASTPEERQKLLKSYLERLGAGEDVDLVRKDFDQAFANVDGSEIAQAEQELIAGGTPVEKVQQLCDVHASLFDGKVSEPPATRSPESQPGHPVWVMREENAAITQAISQVRDHIAQVRGLSRDATSSLLADTMASDVDLLSQAFVHYKRKEELLFPHLESHGVTGPSKVMWGKDDEVRRYVKMAGMLLDGAKARPSAGNLSSVADQLEDAANEAESMVTKEENVLIPLALENLTPTEWTQIAAESSDFGYSYIAEPPAWKADALSLAEDKLDSMAADGALTPAATQPDGADTDRAATDVAVHLSTGDFTIPQLEAIFATIPLDLTFVDADDKTRFFSHGDTRVFPRPKSCLGRDVYACHPPKSQAMVHQVFDDFRSGARDSYEFWIHLKGRFIYIRYFAVRDTDGTYLGALETTQDITEIHELEGDNRRGADVRREARESGNAAARPGA